MLCNIQSKRKPIYDDFEELPASTGAALTPYQPIPVSSAEAAEQQQKQQQAEQGPATATATAPRRGPTPTDRLAVQIGRARLFLYRQACAAEDSVNAAMDRAFALEHSFTSTLAALAPPRESGERLMPGAVYVLVAAMAGSILTRRSNVVLRAAVPTALGVGAGWAVLPVTMRNCADLAWRYEQRFPAVADAHLRAREAVERSGRFVKVHAELGKRMADEKVTAAREGLEDWVKKGK
ncbi:uncharacterized protein E0L32_001070 [Thyridium curvatum]|uniref:MICOS complex subunit n=1 Tax=Thyridium curvatum TaxID=1093900 RepID=A0A507AMY9_9PEZI|nr:uncharacterized protein E0L32_001070 [Thyridium curvatum]TPX11252.1 hypothetical protein E0L32_001070 [Thyridium curvatum]